MINIQNLKKYFGEIKAVDGISFNVQQGEMFGLVGPDGAGKTTTIKILCGLLNPESGNATLFEKDLKKERDRKSTRLNSSHIPLSRMPSSA